jgi:hypothetical protein
MSGFLAAKERVETMNRRLENYHQSSLNADHASVRNKTAFIPEAKFERVGKSTSTTTNPAGNRTATNPAGNRTATNPAGNRTTTNAQPPQPAAQNTLFGIELTRDNCLIIALILMLMKEKAELPLIAALIFLLI